MATFTTSATLTELLPNPGFKEIIVETSSDFRSDRDQVQMTLADHGIAPTGFISINGYQMSATYGVVVTEEPRTEVYSGVLFISGVAAIVYPAKKIFRVVGKST